MSLQSIQMLRGIAALLVLVGHVAQTEIRFLDNSIAPAGLMTGFSGVDLFFVISGFIMVYATRGLPQFDTPSVARFLYARVTRIYPNYWLFSLIMIAAIATVPGLTRSVSDLDLVASFLLLPSQTAPVLVVAWTLIHEMYFYLVFACFLIAPARWLPTLLAVWILAVALAGWGAAGNLNAVTAVIASPLTAEFVLGCGVGLLVMSGRRGLALPMLLAGLSLWLAANVYLTLGPGSLTTPHGWMRVLLWGLPSAIVLYGCVCLELDRGIKAPEALVQIGDWSYALYLCHLPIVAIIARIWTRYGPDIGLFDNVLVMVLGASASLIIAKYAFMLIERPALIFARRMGRKLFTSAPEAGARAPADRIW